MRGFAVLLCLAILSLAATTACADPTADARASLALAVPPKSAPAVKPHLPPSPNCKCGCVDTGKCVCKDCDHPKGKSPNPPTPNCQCGCTETGRCDCKDCDHPRIEPRKKSPRADGNGFCSDQCVCGCNGGDACTCNNWPRAASPPAPTLMRVPPQVPAVQRLFLSAPARSCGAGG